MTRLKPIYTNKKIIIESIQVGHVSVLRALFPYFLEGELKFVNKHI